MSKTLSARKMVKIVDSNGSTTDAMSVITVRDPFTDHFNFLKVTPLVPISMLGLMSESPAAVCVIFWFMTVLGQDGSLNGPGWIYATPDSLGEDLNLSARTIFRVYCRLQDPKKCFMEKRASRSSIYRLVPDLVMKGSLQRIKCSDSRAVIIPSDKTRVLIRKAMKAMRVT